VKRQWIAFAAVIAASFAVLGWTGVRVYQQAPPVPERVVTQGGRVVIGPGEIAAGQDVWRSLGGMEMGSIWGHGSYVAPDWTADYLHREAEIVLDTWSRDAYQRPYASIESGSQAALRDRLQRSFRANGFDRSRGALVIDDARAEAFARNIEYYGSVFSRGRRVRDSGPHVDGRDEDAPVDRLLLLVGVGGVGDASG
jgi:nitric oxide reductase subunit B